MSVKRTSAVFLWLASLALVGLLFFLLGEQAGEGVRQQPIGGQVEWLCRAGQWVASGSPVSAPPGTGCGPTATTTPGSEANIRLEQPAEGASVGKRFEVSGQARVFENQLAVRVSAASQKLLERSVYASSANVGLFGPFGLTVDLPVLASGTPILIEAFQYSAKDGTEIDKASRTVYAGASTNQP